MKQTVTPARHETVNPLDSVEDILIRTSETCHRAASDELTVSINGRVGTYNLAFLWQEEKGALQLFCNCEGLVLPDESHAIVSEILRRLNETLWIGHFDVPPETGTPCFRHTCLLAGWTHESGLDLVQGLFRLIESHSDIPEDALDLILVETDGHA